MNAYFVKCRDSYGLEAISTRLYYFKSQAEQVIKELNQKNDGYTYFLLERQI